MSVILEVCAGSYRSALAAAAGGADRIELCSGLSEGGLTPSYGVLRAALQIPNLKKHVLIRPRSGDFLYSHDELLVMADDVALAADLGADGVVIGALTKDGDVDMDAMGLLMERSVYMDVTFHRAIDVCRNPLKALEDIISLGCHHVLTSGQAATAEDGVSLIKKMVEVAAGRISIMPGCGVAPSNVAKIVRETGVYEIHASAKGIVNSLMEFRHPGVSMGNKGTDEYACVETLQTIVEELKGQL